MTKPESCAQEFARKVEAACRRDHKSRKTLLKYSGYALRFARWLYRQKHLRDKPSEIKVSSYLSSLATRPNGCSARTQDGALNALVFAYKKGLETPLGRMPDWVKAPDRQRLPVWVSTSEFLAIERHLKDAPLELAQIMFGSGLRHSEALQLRVRDLDFDAGLIVVREGKGFKDRTVPMPKLLVAPLHDRIRRLEDLWKLDRDNKVPGVWLPDDVGRKYPKYGEDWPWQWVFPGRSLSKDPETGIIRRHHVHDDTMPKALQRAARLARLGKRITVHSLRHGFATAFLTNGGSIHILQKLLGHKDIETTSIYLHCIAQYVQTVTSPLDVRPNVVPFVAPTIEVPQPLRKIV